MKKELKQLSKGEYQALMVSGMLWEFYPEATGSYYIDKYVEPVPVDHTLNVSSTLSEAANESKI